MIVKSAIDLGESLDVDDMLADDSLAESCTYDDRYTDERTTEDGVTYLVDYDWYNNCGETESSYVVGLAQSDPPDEAIFFDFLIADAADEEAFDTFLRSFSLDRDLIDAAVGGSADAGTEEATTDTGTEESTAEEGSEAAPALSFVDVTDDSGTISLRVPETWTDTVSEDWDLGDGPIGAAFTAAPDVQGFNDTWDVPGVFVGVSEEVAANFTPSEVLDVFDFNEDCTYDDRYDYESGNLAGEYDVWADCGGVEGGTFVVLAAIPVAEESPLVLLYINMPTESDTEVFGELVDTLAIAGAVTSGEETQQEELLTQPLAVVEVDSLNIRSGPGTNYNRVGVASQGDALVIEGQVDNCDWLQVTAPDGVAGWASGKSQYVTLDTRCADIPEAERPAPPAASAAPQEGGARSGQGDQGSSAAGGSGQGCYTLLNRLGAELTVTITRSETGQGTTFKVAGNGEARKCFDPGRYTYTIDAPPPWNSINGELTVQAGDEVDWTIGGE
jgi:serine protease Do